MGLVSRALVLGAAFAAGTWVGLRPPKRAPAAEPPKAESAPSPLPVDPSALPDPVPWPRTNPDCSLHRAWLLAEGPAPDRDGRRLVTFTFDDGPTTDVTPQVLRALRRHGVAATFFFVGQSLRGKPEYARAARAVAADVAAAGHLVGSHTGTHALLTQIDHTRALAEIDDGIDTVAGALGKRPVLFRPPYGQLDAFGEGALRARGLELVLWSVAADDKKDEASMFESLRDQLEYAGGGVVLMHDTRPETAGALGRLLDWLRARRFDPARPKRTGYDVVDLVTYLRATAAHPQPYADRAALEKARATAFRAAHPRAAEPKPTAPAEGD